MTKFDHEIEIDAPIDYVFQWGIQPDNWQRSTPSLLSVEAVEETDEGTHYRNEFKMLGRTVESDELYTVDEANHETVSAFDDDGMRGEMRFSYTETDDGTHVRLHGDIEAGTSLFDRAIQPVVTRYMNRQFRNTLATMKELAEIDYAESESEPAAA